MNPLQLRRALLLVALVCLVLATSAWAQQTKTEVRRGEVVYVSGNDLVVKTEDGQIKHVVVPEGATAVVDGKTLTVRDLKPGMKLTRTITTTETPKTVTTVRTISGTVWNTMGNNVILTLPSGENKQYKVPEGTKFNVAGNPNATVFDLRKGMKVSATVVTTTPEIEVSQQRSVTGTAPPPPTPVTQVGVLLVEEAPAPRQVAAAAPAPQAEPAPGRLPKTASDLPLIGLLSIWLVAICFGLRAIRRLRLDDITKSASHN
jgi:hypothetical protein